MRCEHGNEMPPATAAELPSRDGAGPRLCAACAYAVGYRHALKDMRRYLDSQVQQSLSRRRPRS